MKLTLANIRDLKKTKQQSPIQESMQLCDLRMGELLGQN